VSFIAAKECRISMKQGYCSTSVTESRLIDTDPCGLIVERRASYQPQAYRDRHPKILQKNYPQKAPKTTVSTPRRA
jgi:hypothetical protein